jgi:ABC-2 type transport system permease protein
MLRIYQRMGQVNWAEQWQYRANLFMYVLYWLVGPIVYIAVWTSIARAQGNVSGLTANDFIIYYMIMLLVDQVTGETVVYNFAYKIQDGSLSSEIILPVHPLLTRTLMNNLAFKVMTSLVLIPVWILLSLLFQPTFSAVTWTNVLLAVPAMVFGFAINFLLSSAIVCIAFWTTRVWALYRLYGIPVALFSGQFVPLQLMPKIIQTLSVYLPFQLFKYFPTQLILGKLSTADILRGYGMDILWLVIVYIVFRLAWRGGLKQYTAVGA